MNKPNINPAPSYTIAIEENALNFFREYALIAFISIVSFLSLAAIIIFFELKSPFPIYWIVCVTIVQLISYFFRRTLPSSNLTRSRKIKLATILNFFDGLVIGSLIVFMPYLSDITRTILVFMMVTNCIGATITTLGYQPFFLSFCIPISISLLLSSVLSATLWGGSNELYAVFILSFAICIFIYSVSKDIYRSYQDSYRVNLENKEMNQELKLAVYEAKHANQSKTRFLAAASHDLRQPINTISLFIATLSLKNLKPDENQIIEHMSSAVNTMDTQLNSLLELSKLDSGIIIPKTSDVDIVPILRSMTSIYSDQHQPDILSFSFKGSAIDALVNTDQTLFERIIQNIVGNSIKYTPSGHIDVLLEKVDENILSISVSDNGIGISEENLSNIYDEFYQVENQERDSKKGFGLGLSIVKRLCELLNIKIEIKSVLGKGTTVQLTMPFLRHPPNNNS